MTYNLQRFHRDTRVKCYMASTPPDPTYNPKLYIRSTWEPRPSMNPDGLLERLENFKSKIKGNCRVQTAPSNLPSHLKKALLYLQTNDEYLVVKCDKNLGPALIEKDAYIKMIIRDHLSDDKTYIRLSADEAINRAQALGRRIRSWIDTHKQLLTKDEIKFLLYHLNKAKQTPFSYFYGMMKVHKYPLKTRPVVSYSGSISWALGVWIDTKLQQVAHQQRSFFKDTFELKALLDEVTIHPNDRLFTADAVAMYTNIPTEKGLCLITNYLLQRFSHEVPVQAITDALDIVMKNNIFMFGDMHFQQKTGTAMGAPPAPPWATIYMAISENQFLPYQKNLRLYKRFIDDVIGIWRWDGDSKKWDYFKTRLNNPFFELQWEISDLKKQINFMDLTITLEGNKIVTTLFEKPNNLHLFIPSKSCHPPGLLRGMINGHVYRIRKLCTHPPDQLEKLQRYFRCLLARGYDRDQLRRLFYEASSKKRAKESSDKNRLFFHIRYHPKNISPRTIQMSWRNTIQSPPNATSLKDMKNCFGVRTGIDTLVVAQSRSPNLGNLLSYRKLKDDNGPPASFFMN